MPPKRRFARKAEQVSADSLRQLRALAELVPDDFSMVSEGRRYGKAETLAKLDEMIRVEEEYQAAKRAYAEAVRAAREAVPGAMALANEIDLLLRREKPEVWNDIAHPRPRRPVRKGTPARRFRKRPKPETK